LIRPQKGIFAFEIFEKNAVFLFIRKQYLAIFGYLKKSASRLPVTIFETLFWLGVLARITTNRKHQKSH